MNRSPDFEVQTVAAAGAVYSPAFRAPDRLAVQITIETSGGAGVVTAVPQHSNDGGATWLDKTALTLTGSGAYAGTAVSQLSGADDGSVPSLELMRLKITCSVGTPNVRGYIHGRSY